MTANRLLCAGLAAGFACGWTPTTAFAQANVDLNAWTEITTDSNGFWDVDNNGQEGSGPNGTFVRQEVNGAPTIFLSPDNFINTQINGSFSVDPTSDNDFIGFVFGVQNPSSSTLDALLFDWKQGNQSGATEGFRLSYVTGDINNSVSTSNPFWTHTTNANTTFQPLGTNFNSEFGWVDGGPTVYDFALDYSQTNITITIAGGQFGLAGLEVFNVDVDDTDVSAIFPDGAFPDGQFGFYNFSQTGVIYESFTRTDDPVLASTPVDGGTLDFGNVRVTGSATEALDIVNAGGPGSTLTGSVPSPDDPAFALITAPDSFTLGEGATAAFDYTFTPITRGSFADELNVASNDPADLDGHDFTLAGQGVGPVLDAPLTADFGDVDADGSASVFLTLANTTPDGDLGDLTDLTLNNLLLTGDDADRFSLVGFTPGSTIAAGGSLQIEVLYTGDGTLGPLAATLTLQTDVDVLLGADGRDFDVTLTANAIPEPVSGATLLSALALLSRRRSGSRRR